MSLSRWGLRDSAEEGRGNCRKHQELLAITKKILGRRGTIYPYAAFVPRLWGLLSDWSLTVSSE